MRQDTYERDGIIYDIALVECDETFRATWTCPVCHQSGGLSSLCCTPAEAMGRAKANAFSVHHVPVHALRRTSVR
jgi:hypothetical protein